MSIFCNVRCNNIFIKESRTFFQKGWGEISGDKSICDDLLNYFNVWYFCLEDLKHKYFSSYKINYKCARRGHRKLYSPPPQIAVLRQRHSRITQDNIQNNATIEWSILLITKCPIWIILITRFEMKYIISQIMHSYFSSDFDTSCE